MTKTMIRRALDKFPTPFYVFDEAEFCRRAEHIRVALPAGVGLCYAMKANPFLLRCASSCVDRLEVCSTGEMRICQHEGVSMGRVVVSGVHKDAELMRELMQQDDSVCRYTAESELQFSMLERTARELGVRIPLLIRLTSGNQFGVDRTMARELSLRAHASDAFDVRGIHYFAGTQRTSPKRLARELRRVDDFLCTLQDELGCELAELEYGAGLPVEYFVEDDEQAARVGEEQLHALGNALSCLRFGGSVVVELGRALAASCGTYATRVVDTKTNGGNNYAIVDGGMHQLVYYGHAMSLQQPALELMPDRSQASQDTWSFYGSLCTTNDVLAKQIACGEVHVGDVVVFRRAGAYCMTEGISLFLSRDLPRLVLSTRDGDFELIRDRVETYPLNTPCWHNTDV